MPSITAYSAAAPPAAARNVTGPPVSPVEQNPGTSAVSWFSDADPARMGGYRRGHHHWLPSLTSIVDAQRRVTAKLDNGAAGDGVLPVRLETASVEVRPVDRVSSAT